MFYAVLPDGMHISEVPKFLAYNPSETAHAIELVEPLNTTWPLNIPLHLNRVTSYFDVHYPNVAEYENDDNPKIHLETQMINHCQWISIPATAARGPVFVSTAYDATDVMHNDNLVTALES